MSVMKTIEIDVEVNAFIEGARQNFNESQNTILRRIFKIADASLSEGPAHNSPSISDKSGWRGVHRKTKQVVHLPDGTEMRADYTGQLICGAVRNGEIWVNGKCYKKLSPALHENVVTSDGKHTQLNGWLYWEVKRPDEMVFRPIVPR